MFGAAFAGSVGEPILKQQQNDIALLRDRLNQIAITERTMAQQRLAGQQAEARNLFTQQQQNFRESLNQIGQDRRAQFGARTRREEDLAEIGFTGDISSLNDEQLINYTSVLNRINQDEEDEIERQKREIDVAMATMRLSDQIGIRIDPTVWDDPAKVAVLSEAAAQKRALDELEDDFGFDLAEMNELAEMGVQGAELVDTYFSIMESMNIEISPGKYFRGMMTKAKALHPKQALSDFQFANNIVKAAEEGVYNRYFPGGKMPTSDDLLMDDTGQVKEQLARMGVALEEFYNNDHFSNMLEGATGWSTNAVRSPGKLTYEDMVGRYEQIKYDRAQAEQEEGARRDNLEDFTASQTVQRERMFAELKTDFDALVELQDWKSIENLAFRLEEEAVQVSGNPEYVAPPGTDYLGQADYLAMAEWVRGNLRVLQEQIMRSQFEGVGGVAEVPRQFGPQGRNR
jgi:hypothetical protein